MILASYILTALTIGTFWLVFPMFIMLPIAFILGVAGLVTSRKKGRGAGEQLLAVVAILFSVAALIGEMYVMNATYRS